MKEFAESITVRVTTNKSKSGGSGTLIRKDGSRYTLLTNAHVLGNDEAPYRIETPDKKTYSASVVESVKFSDNDLVLLEFVSDSNYATANFPDLTNINASKYVNLGEKVYATGFPFDEENLNFTTGTVGLFPQKTFKTGYRIGYTNAIKKGMSGGPILNRFGELIGLNGRHSYPLFGDPFVFQDGTRPSETEREKMLPLSWGVPVEILAQTASQFLNPPSQTLTGLPSDIATKAKQIAVRIERKVGGGSGVIIASHKENGNKYTYHVLTAAHVVETEQDYTIITPDNKRYTIKPGTEKKSKSSDIAVLSFTSDVNYSVATLGNYELKDKSYSFVFGWPISNNYTKPISLLTSGSISSPQTTQLYHAKDVFSLQNGYELAYSNMTQGGMSGGPVFDTQGRVIGIHGQIEAEDGVNIGYSLGIPSKKILGLIDNFGIQKEWLRVETSAPPLPEKEEVDNILQMSLTIAKPSNQAKEEDWISYGNQLWRFRKYSDAIDAFDKALAINPKSSLAWYARGLAVLAQDNYVDAVRCFSKAVEIKPDFYAAWRKKGDAHDSLKQYGFALDAIERAIEEAEKQNQKDFALYWRKGVTLNNLKRDPEAIIAYTKSIEIQPHPYPYNNRGSVYSDKGDKDNAFKDFNEAIKLDPKFAYAYNNRGSLYSDKGDYDNALKDYNEAIKLDPKNAKAYNNRGNLYADKGDYDNALKDLNEAIKLDPKLAAAYDNRGSLYSDKGDNENAFKDYNEAIKLDPKYANAYGNRAFVYYDKGDYDNALKDFNEAIKLDPKYARAYNGRGLVYEKMGNQEKAIAEFKTAILYCGTGALNCQVPQRNLNRIQNKSKGDNDNTLKDLNEAIKLDPKDAKAYYNRGFVYYKKGDNDNALKDYNEAIKLDPKYAIAYNNRGLVYLGKGDYDNALKDFNEAIKLDPKFAQAYVNRGAVYSDKGDNDNALKDFNEAIKLDPKYALAYDTRGLVYEKMGNQEKAIADFQKALLYCGTETLICEYPQNHLNRLQKK
ncbi:serine protease [Tychonema bourrellyi]|uniref:serine protease n=1 Tax=Tychonema bourrellyi TaxID=54313 RepID=UPI0015D4BC05|nr:serine protease [Tychonema bourrellyi]